jgi:hypothetical protein
MVMVEENFRAPALVCVLVLGLARPAVAARCGGQACKKRAHESWLKRVARAQAAQPSWITPIVTVTPRLEQEFRSDLSHESQPLGQALDVLGGGKGLELIPASRVEVILGVPAYFIHKPEAVPDGFGDFSALVKYRLLAHNAADGNSILTLFFGASVPTGSRSNSASHAVFTPTIAAGKGWGKFDVQATLGAALPAEDITRAGSPFISNTAFQYRVFKRMWPEVEINTTWWPNGSNRGKDQVFLTPGIVFGKIRLRQGLGLTLGVGVQTAVTCFHTYNHNWIFSVRFPF